MLTSPLFWRSMGAPDALLRPDAARAVDGATCMPFAAWWRGDPLPDLPPPIGFQARRVTDHAVLEPLTHLRSQEIERRLQGGHDIYVAFLDEVASGYGWVAHRQ